MLLFDNTQSNMLTFNFDLDQSFLCSSIVELRTKDNAYHNFGVYRCGKPMKFSVIYHRWNNKQYLEELLQ